MTSIPKKINLEDLIHLLQMAIEDITLMQYDISEVNRFYSPPK